MKKVFILFFGLCAISFLGCEVGDSTSCVNGVCVSASCHNGNCSCSGTGSTCAGDTYVSCSDGEVTSVRENSSYCR